jgi:hypothetical protein
MAQIVELLLSKCEAGFKAQHHHHQKKIVWEDKQIVDRLAAQYNCHKFYNGNSLSRDTLVSTITAPNNQTEHILWMLERKKYVNYFNGKKKKASEWSNILHWFLWLGIAHILSLRYQLHNLPAPFSQDVLPPQPPLIPVTK